MLKLRCTPFNFLVWNLLSRNREKKTKRKKTKTFDLNLLKPSAYKEMLLKRDQSGREKWGGPVLFRTNRQHFAGQNSPGRVRRSRHNLFRLSLILSPVIALNCNYNNKKRKQTIESGTSNILRERGARLPFEFAWELTEFRLPRNCL